MFKMRNLAVVCLCVTVLGVGCKVPGLGLFGKGTATNGSESQDPEGQTREGSNPVVIIKTSLGDIKVELDQLKAPVSVRNFLQYVDDGYYTDTIFHRVIKVFMIQGGGMTADLERKPGTRDPILCESQNGLKNVRGSLAMARTSDPNSATAQFFINVVDNASLDYPSRDGHGYAVFGRVVEGMDVVDKIRNVPTTSIAFHNDVPRESVSILEVVRAE